MRRGIIHATASFVCCVKARASVAGSDGETFEKLVKLLDVVLKLINKA